MFRDDTVFIRKFSSHLIKGVALAVLCLYIFSLLADELLEQELTNFDRIITGFVRGFTTPGLTSFMKLVSNMGSFLVLVSVALVAFLILRKHTRHYWDSAMVAINLTGVWLLNELLKRIFHRPRPDIDRLVEVTGYSFPSGHAMINMGFYGFLAYILWVNLKGSPLRYLTTAVLGMLILLIGISRVYLGAHYPSDVLAGFAAGGFWLVGSILALQTVRHYKRKTNSDPGSC